MQTRMLLIVIVLLPMLSGCSSFFGYGSQGRSGTSSSLVDYLYPEGEIPPEVGRSIPSLELPVRVGIAFVPGGYSTSVISEASKIALLEEVKKEFSDREFIAHIEVIPETYLRSARGVKGMQQVARLYGVDVMALVSYDQVAFTEDNPSSLLYWTIVGSYLIKATSNEVHTFVDTAVFDVQTSRLLFRAPGVNQQSDRSTLVESDEVVRKTRDASFSAAMDSMTVNLASELDAFRERVKEDASVADVTWNDGRGGGAFGFPMLLVLMVARRCRRRSAAAA